MYSYYLNLTLDDLLNIIKDLEYAIMISEKDLDTSEHLSKEEIIDLYRDNLSFIDDTIHYLDSLRDDIYNIQRDMEEENV